MYRQPALVDTPSQCKMRRQLMQHGFHLPQFQSKQERETNLSKILPSWYAIFAKSIKKPNNLKLCTIL